ncbi:MAG: PD40 domain-containing protein [Acidobacteria bacterium]|nr:PD40 domain-containing protein [Acidobacteriota bacterium]
MDIWVSQRASLDAPWGTPQNLGPNINTPQSDHCALLPPDGHTLIFASTRPGGLGVGTEDLYIARRRNQRDDFGWDFPENLGSGVNSASADWGPGSFEDEDTGNYILYFNSNRPGLGGFNVYASVLGNDGTFGPAVLVPELSSAFNDTFPTPRRDGLELFLTSNRTGPGTLGGNDLWVSTRASTSDLWSAPANLGAPINSTAMDSRGAIAFNRTNLIFFSNRAGGLGGQDLYEITREKLTGKD